MRQATNISTSHTADLNTGYMAVAQKGNVGSKYIYAEQLRNDQHEIHVLRGYAGNVTTPVVTMYGSAGGHTQTWEYSGRSGKWFVGTKPGPKWDKQIARVDISPLGKVFYSNTDLPRLAYLNRAGGLLKPDGSTYAGDDMKRAEAAVSPDYSKFLLATMDNWGNGYFTIYDNNLINDKLDSAEYNNDYVSLDGLSCLESFVVPGFYSAVKSSVQGYDLDNEGNIYVSSQESPDTIGHQYYTKNIFKIPTFARTDTSSWLQINLDNNSVINIYGQGMHTELEGIQILNENQCYLTVAYHKTVGGKNKTVSNKIYEVSWNE
ncbi:helveticin J family class III bacteriocin [Lactobacillus crispatus]|uniref:helveticin J family class III bacteriocin n=1 Tax=Lactobacillus crispatus TaxID=47770 RepID=UPI001E45C012|nr:helveticin J family class III bacteriocin [Lactobacillus crispatus]